MIVPDPSLFRFIVFSKARGDAATIRLGIRFYMHTIVRKSELQDSTWRMTMQTTVATSQ
jgi:hypothetical protein